MAIRGVQAHEELKTERIRKGKSVWRSFLQNRQVYFPYISLGIGVLIFVCSIISRPNIMRNVPLFAHLFPVSDFFISNAFLLILSSILLLLSALLKKSRAYLDPPEKATHYLGYDYERNEPLFSSNMNMRRHIFILGGTGSGKTVAINAFFYQTVFQGGGCVYIDGKAKDTSFEEIYYHCRKAGRLNDLLVINYLTSQKKKISNNDSVLEAEMLIRSNTVNIFSGGNDDEIKELMIAMIRDTSTNSANDVFTGRAITFISALLTILVWQRDNDPSFQLTLRKIQEYLPLDKVVELVNLGRSGKIPYEIYSPLEEYFKSVPGYNKDEEDSFGGEISEQHNYISFQLTEGFNLFLNTYREIFDVDSGAIDFKDLNLRKRILYVMMPSIEKSSDTLNTVGKLIVSGLKKAISQALGGQLQGHASETFRVNPAASDVPFLIILDEFRYYKAKGVSNLAAQARELGASLIIAAQSIAGLLEDGFEFETAELIANTKYKYFFSIDPNKETMGLIEMRSGKANVATLTGFSTENSTIFEKLSKEKRRAIAQLERIDIRDLLAQKPGEAHLVCGDQLFRVRMSMMETEPVSDPNDPRGFIHLNITIGAPVNPAQDKVVRFRLNKNMAILNDYFSFEEDAKPLNAKNHKVEKSQYDIANELLTTFAQSNKSLKDEISSAENSIYKKSKSTLDKMFSDDAPASYEPLSAKVKAVKNEVQPHSVEASLEIPEVPKSKAGDNIVKYLAGMILGKKFPTGSTYDQQINAIAQAISLNKEDVEDEELLQKNLHQILNINNYPNYNRVEESRQEEN